MGWAGRSGRVCVLSVGGMKTVVGGDRGPKTPHGESMSSVLLLFWGGISDFLRESQEEEKDHEQSISPT